MNPINVIIGNSVSTVALRAQLTKLSVGRKNILLIGEPGTGKSMIASTLGEIDSSMTTMNLSPVKEYKVATLLGNIGSGTVILEGLDESSFAVQSEVVKIMGRHNGDLRYIVTLREKAADLSAKRRLIDEIYTKLLEFESVEILPLRKRPEDIPHLVRYFAEDMIVDINALETLTRQVWKDNVRELKTVVQMCLDETKDGAFFLPKQYVEDRSEIAQVVNTMLSGNAQGLDASLDEMEKNIIQRALHRFGFNTSKAAEFLGMSDHTLADKLQRLALVESKR
ncbi:MAG: helix-turn-helix domain-containing protein [Bacteroidota bacterium]